MYRDADKQLRSAQKHQDMIDIYLYLCKVYVRLDQPLTSVEVCKQGLEKFQGETTLLANIARIYEVLLLFSYLSWLHTLHIFTLKCVVL